MKKTLSFITNEKGFFLPYVMLITTVLFIVITTNAHIYHNDLRIIHKMLEQLKIETLIQMGHTTFKEEIVELDPNQDSVMYEFPYGTVEITYIPFEKEIHLYFKISTDENSQYTITNRINMSQFKESNYLEPLMFDANPR